MYGSPNDRTQPKTDGTNSCDEESIQQTPLREREKFIKGVEKYSMLKHIVFHVAQIEDSKYADEGAGLFVVELSTR